MADTNKAEKLAAARKKLKEFQQRSRQSPVSNPIKDRTDLSSPASVTSQNSSIELKSTPYEYFPTEHPPSQPVASHEYSYQQPLFDNNYGSQVNYYSEGIYSAEQPPNQVPYYNNEQVLSSVPLAEESLRSSEAIRKNSNSFGLNGENSTLLSQLADKDNTIATLQNQLQNVSISANAGKQYELQNALQDLEQQWSQKVAALEDQLRVHTQTVNILVAEKSENQASLAKANESLKTKTIEATEVQSQLRAVVQKLSETEAALSASKADHSSKHQIVSDSQRRCDELTAELKKSESGKEEYKHQASQLQQRINVTMQQVTMLQTELRDKQSQLTSTQVRLKQLGGSLKESSESTILDDLRMEKEKSSSLEKQIADMKADFAEKEQASNQYQQFVHQLNQQLSTLATKLQEANVENEQLKEQNEQMVEHVGSLESRLNKVGQQNVPAPVTTSNDELEKIKAELHKAFQENDKLKQELNNQDLEKASYEESMLRYQETIRRMEEERPDEKKLMAAMESDRVAAQRATSQNTKLKDQLLEMEQMKAQMIEQLHTFEARARQAQSLQECLLDAQNEIKNLKNQLNQKQEEKPETNHVNGNSSDQEDSPLSPEASIKLQGRFTDVMRKLADTSDEKQKLEHLVMQLQGETETIGEYVALYQQQRCLLRERSAEKDREIARMAVDREELLLKMKQVGHLVLQLVNGQRENNSVPLTEPKDYETVALEIADQVTGLLNKMEESNHEVKTLTDEELLAMHGERNNGLGMNQDTLLPCPCCSGRLEVV